MEYRYRPEGVCSREIIIEIENDIIKNLKIVGGCPGNLQALPRLVEGMTVEEIEKKLSGIDCAGRGTSCADQLVRAVKKAYEESKNK